MPLVQGTTLGPYEILALIGAGGMGEVYRARDTRLAREVAVKVIRDRLDAEAQAQFEQEARMIAALSHPNTLVIFDVGQHQGVPYLVTELLVGHTLRERIDNGPLPLAEVLAITRQVADALGSAHERSIVHRDVKPENVFVLPSGVAKLMDFGVAKQRVRSSETAETVVADGRGLVSGTIGYMAPEQVRGFECDPRTDIFALGVMLYEMVAGVRPFDGPTQADIIGALLSADPPPLSTRGAPPGLERIVRRALAKEPTHRFQSMRELASVLEMLAPDACPAGGTDVVRAPSLAVLPFVDLSPNRDQEYFCEGIAEEILGGLARVPRLRVASASASQHFRGRRIDLQEVGRTLNVESVLEGSVRTSGSRMRIAVRLTDIGGHVSWSEQFDRELADVFEVQEDIARAVVEAMRSRMSRIPAPTGVASTPWPLVQVPTPDAEAYTLYLKGRFHWNRRTETSLLESVNCFEGAIRLDPRFARALAGLADAHTALGIYGLRHPALTMPLAKTAAMEALHLNESLADAHASLGTVLALHEWAWSDAEQAFQRAVVLDPSYATGLQWYAVHGLAPRARFAEAVDLLTRAQASDPLALPVVVSLAFLYYLDNRMPDAADVLGQALRLDDSFAAAHFFMAHVRSETEEHALAMRHAERAMALSGGSPETLATLGYAAARAGRPDVARRVIADLQRASAARYVSPGLEAQVLTALGDTGAALARLAEAVQVRAADAAWLAVRPTFSPLRGLPQFAELVDRIGVRRTSELR